MEQHVTDIRSHRGQRVRLVASLPRSQAGARCPWSPPRRAPLLISFLAGRGRLSPPSEHLGDRVRTCTMTWPQTTLPSLWHSPRSTSGDKHRDQARVLTGQILSPVQATDTGSLCYFVSVSRRRSIWVARFELARVPAPEAGRLPYGPYPEEGDERADWQARASISHPHRSGRIRTCAYHSPRVVGWPLPYTPLRGVPPWTQQGHPFHTTHLRAQV
jgi:hypothetical protein